MSEPLGSAGRDVLAALQEWARTNLPAAGEHATTCQWCPLCQFASVLRGEQPEVSNQVAEAGAALANALRAVVDAASTAAPPRRRPRPGPRPPQTPRVERIDLE